MSNPLISADWVRLMEESARLRAVLTVCREEMERCADEARGYDAAEMRLRLRAALEGTAELIPPGPSMRGYATGMTQEQAEAYAREMQAGASNAAPMIDWARKEGGA